MDISYNIIATGSKGNAVIVEGGILIDVGIPYKKLEEYVSKIKLVLLTHIHGDHFNPATIRKLAKERPMLRFGCGRWLVYPLIECGVKPENIDILIDGYSYNYNGFKIEPFEVKHNVKNHGYKVHYQDGRRLFYCTDCNNLNGIKAVRYDLYMIEDNYEDGEIRERIEKKELAGEYAYEKKVLNNHLSKAKADDFIFRNLKDGGKVVYLHRHTEFTEKQEAENEQCYIDWQAC